MKKRQVRKFCDECGSSLRVGGTGGYDAVTGKEIVKSFCSVHGCRPFCSSETMVDKKRSWWTGRTEQECRVCGQERVTYGPDDYY